MDNGDKRLVLTIGHSTLAVEEFIDLLKDNSVTLVVDIRTVPRSRHNPQYNQDVLPGELARAGIGYLHLPGLGGLRHPRPDTVNKAWRNVTFRGFADYMQTSKFNEQIETLLSLIDLQRIVLMCAEAVPWRCHRSLIADALTIRGIKVEHIMGKSARRQHVFTPWAKVRGVEITYPSPENKTATSREKTAKRS